MENQLIKNTVEFVKLKLEGAEAGHDWFHIDRVWKLSKIIAEKEGGDLQTIELGALLHDIADPKFHNGDEDLALKISQDFLSSQSLSDDKIRKVLFIIKNISFKNRKDQTNFSTEDPVLELNIVQDADRLDAIGAIGIARTFNFGGFKNNLMHHPDLLPKLNMTKEEYKKSEGTTINHFYEKLLLLKDLMNTNTAKELAKKRHDVMQNFLDEFLAEWEVKI